MTTAPSLVDLSGTLLSFSDQLDDYIKSSGDPFSPSMQQLRSMDTHIAIEGAAIARLAVEELQGDVAAAIEGLNGVVADAQNAITTIQNVKTAMSIVASVLSAAVAIGTGNPLGTASAILGLVQGVSGAIEASGS